MRRRVPALHDEPVAAWFSRHGRAVPELCHRVDVSLPGGLLALRTNWASYAAYVRQRCRHLLDTGEGGRMAVDGEVACLSGVHWPTVAPDGTAAGREMAMTSAFESYRRDGVTCVWRSPDVMGSVSGARPARLRMVATTQDPARVRRAAGALRQKCEQPRLASQGLFDLMLCLFAEAVGCTLLHGAVLEHKGRGLLVIGASGSGKTTSALALVRGGFHLRSDEYAVLWKRGRIKGRFDGILVPPMIVGRAPASLDDLEGSLGKAVAIKRPYILDGVERGARPLSVQTILCLTRPARRLRNHHAVPLDPGDTLPRLMGQLLDPVREGRGETLSCLVDVLEGARVYEVTAGTDLAGFPAFVEGLSRGARAEDRC